MPSFGSDLDYNSRENSREKILDDGLDFVQRSKNEIAKLENEKAALMLQINEYEVVPKSFKEQLKIQKDNKYIIDDEFDYWTITAYSSKEFNQEVQRYMTNNQDFEISLIQPNVGNGSNGYIFTLMIQRKTKEEQNFSTIKD